MGEAMMDNIECYEYSSIRPRFIRLLQLRESDACIGEEKTLQGTLKQISLDSSSEPFDAISYACGPAVYCECILIDGRKVLVTKNCHNALRHLRDQFGLRTVWVDAVCINEKNDDEKSGQIRLMTSIYGKARKVYIWLGEHSEDSAADRALDWLQEISVYQLPLLGVRLSNFPKNMHPWEVIKLFGIIPDVIRAITRRLGLASPIAKYEHNAMKDIIRRPWFKRMWTVQEAAMAGEPFIVCGAKAIRWNHLFWGLVEARTRVDDSMKHELSAMLDSISVMYTFWLQISTASEFRESKHRKWFAKDSALFEKWITFLDFMEAYGWIISRIQLAGIAVIVTIRVFRGLRPLNYIPLVILIHACAATVLLTPPKTDVNWDNNLRDVFVNMLNKSRDQQSANPKDKVYALYGLLQQLDIKLPEPDYSENQSLEDTYLGFTYSIIRWHRSLDILLEASGPWGRNAPSWVPDWSKSYRRFQFADARPNTGGSLQTHGSLYTFSENLRELKVSGKRIGKVIFRASPVDALPVVLDVNESSIPTRRVLIKICKNVITLREWLKVVRDGYCLSVDKICDFLASISTWHDVHTTDEFRQWAEVILNDNLNIPGNEILSFTNASVPMEYGRHIIRDVLAYEPFSAGLKWRILLTLAIDEKLWLLHQNICSMLAETMTLFVVKGGDSYMLGVGANCIQADDAVVLLPTLKAPVVVRAVEIWEGKFQLMGATHLPRVPCSPTWSEDDAQNESITLV